MSESYHDGEKVKLENLLVSERKTRVTSLFCCCCNEEAVAHRKSKAAHFHSTRKKVFLASLRTQLCESSEFGQHNTTQHNICNTIQHNTIQHSTLQYKTIQHNIYNTIQHNTIYYPLERRSYGTGNTLCSG
jgi:hypothetical protein